MASPRKLLALIALALLFASGPALAASHKTQRVGSVTWHATRFLTKSVDLVGYVLFIGQGYVLLSDEPGGRISAHDLPVTGPGVETMVPKQKYEVIGVFQAGRVGATNGNPDFLALSQPPTAVK